MTTGQPYDGLMAEVYDLDPPPYDDEAFYRSLIEAGSGPALEMGSGTGRLLVPYRKLGLDVEGVEPSADMARITREKAQAAGVEAVVHQQTMQALDLARRYSAIYVPVSSFQLVDDPEDANEALRRFREHLAPGGRLFVSLSIPTPEEMAASNNQWYLTHRLRRPDGSMVLISSASRANRAKQVIRSTMKYEVFDAAGQFEYAEVHPYALRWYEPAQFSSMLADAGFVDAVCTGELRDETYSEGDRWMMFRARRG